MGLSKDESYWVSYISRFQDSKEPSLDRATSSDHEEDDISFKVMHKARQLASLSALAPFLASIQLTRYL